MKSASLRVVDGEFKEVFGYRESRECNIIVFYNLFLISSSAGKSIGDDVNGLEWWRPDSLAPRRTITILFLQNIYILLKSLPCTWVFTYLELERRCSDDMLRRSPG